MWAVTWASLLLLAGAAVALAAALAAGVLRAELKLRQLIKHGVPHLKSAGFLGHIDLLKDRDHFSLIFAALPDEVGDEGIAAVRIVDEVVMDTLMSPGGRTSTMFTHPNHDGYWKLVRKGAAAAFSPMHMRIEFCHVLEVADQLSELLKSGGPVAFQDLSVALQRQTMDVIGRVGFSLDFGATRSGFGQVAEPDSAFHLARAGLLEVQKRWSEPLRMALRWVLPDARAGEARMHALHCRMAQLLRDLQARGTPPDSDTTIAGHLLRIRHPATGQPQLTDEQLAGEVALTFYAGLETTAHTMAWTLYFIALHPEIEAKVASELHALGLLVTPLNLHPRALEYSDLGRLTYLNMVIKESMRMVPVTAGGTVRRSPQPVQLGRYALPAGVQVCSVIYGVHNSPRNWERPGEFLPERWAEPGVENWPGPLTGPAALSAHRGGAEQQCSGAGRQPVKRYIPFGDGPRSCVGQNLAVMNYTATLAILCSRFKFELPDKLKGPGALWELQSCKVTLQPANGLPMRCVPRPC